MPVTLSDKFKQILGLDKPDPYAGINPQEAKQLIELDREGKVIPPKAPPPQSTTQGGSFKEDYIKYFGQDAWDRKVKQMEEKRPPQ